jgi:hypothetical protein
MNETIQNLRNQAQALLNNALFQTQPELVLAGMPNDAFAKGSEDDSCSWTCMWTCAWTSAEQQL